MRENVRPARPGVGVSVKKFAQRGRNDPKSAFCCVLGEFFRGNAVGWAALGELFRGRATACSHCERVYVRPQSLRRPLISRGPISHAIPLKVFQAMSSNR